eukprot:RCo008007
MLGKSLGIRGAKKMAGGFRDNPPNTLRASGLLPYRRMRAPYYHIRLPRDLLTELVREDQLITTLNRARSLKPIADRFAGLAKRGKAQELYELLNEPFLVEKALADFPIRFAERDAFFARVTPLHYRDAKFPHEAALIEFEDRYKSFDVLYPPQKSFCESLTEADLLKAQKRGRYADVADESDCFMGRDILYQRHPSWKPEYDSYAPNEVHRLIKKAQFVHRFSEDFFRGRAEKAQGVASEEVTQDYYVPEP